MFVRFIHLHQIWHLSQKTQSQLGHFQPQINFSRAPWPPAELSHFKPTCVLWKVTAAARSWRFCHLATLLLPLGSDRCCVSLLFDHQEKAQNNNNNMNNNNNTALHSASTWYYQHSHNKLQHRLWLYNADTWHLPWTHLWEPFQPLLPWET